MIRWSIQLEYELTEDEFDQIDQFTDSLLPTDDFYFSGWYVLFEETLFHIDLVRVLTHYD